MGTAVHVCEILASFSAKRTEASLTEVAAELGIKKSSAHALLRTLVAQGMLQYDPQGRRYRLGAAVARLSNAYRASHSLIEVATPYLEDLRTRTRESAALHVLDRDDYFCLLQIPSLEPIRMELREGQRFSMGTGAAGRVLTAFDSSAANRPATKAVRELRAAGYAVTRGEVIEGAVAIYAPLYDSSGALVAAIGVHGPAFRMPAPVIKRIAGEVRATAAALAAALAPGLPWR